MDVWSLGVVLYICLCGFPPFSDELRTPENPYNLSQQIQMGKFDYPSPYWDSVGDPALDLIDRMLTVDVEQRIGIDKCLEHPWTTGQATAGGLSQGTLEDSQNTVMEDGDHTFVTKSQSSMQSLSSHLRNLDFSKRKPARERTLLSSINDIKISKVVEVPEVAGVPGSQQAVKIFEKNVKGQRCYDTQGKSVHVEGASQAPASPPHQQHQHDVNENGPKGGRGEKKNEKNAKTKTKARKQEGRPGDARAVGEFMQTGGKGDPALFEDH